MQLHHCLRMSSRSLGRLKVEVFKSEATEYVSTICLHYCIVFLDIMTIFFLIFSNRVFALDLWNLRFQVQFKRHQRCGIFYVQMLLPILVPPFSDFFNSLLFKAKHVSLVFSFWGCYCSQKTELLVILHSLKWPNVQMAFSIILDCIMLTCLVMTFQASPIALGGRQVVVEEKRSTNSRGKFKCSLIKCSTQFNRQTCSSLVVPELCVIRGFTVPSSKLYLSHTSAHMEYYFFCFQETIIEEDFSQEGVQDSGMTG